MVQEYGRPATELIDGLRQRGAEVTTVPVYQWDLPVDRGPLREAVKRLAAGEFDRRDVHHFHTSAAPVSDRGGRGDRHPAGF